MAKVTMPQLGESVAEGTIGKWLKQPGDTVDKYEPLLEVITDKVNAEVPSPFAGILKEILVEEGATVPNNAEIAVIETADEGARRRHRRPAAAARGRADAAPAAPDAGARGSTAPRRGAGAAADRSPPTAPPAPTSARERAAARRRGRRPPTAVAPTADAPATPTPG